MEPYKVLGLSPDCTDKELKKRFLQLRLKFHPDKKNGCAKTYLDVMLAHEMIREFRDHKMEFMMKLDVFKSRYQGSQEEIDELCKRYKQYRGNLRKILDMHILSDHTDEQRVRMLLDPCIESGLVPEFPKYRKEVRLTEKRLKKIERDREELEKFASALGERRSLCNKDFVNELERKYCHSALGSEKPARKKAKGSKEAADLEEVVGMEDVLDGEQSNPESISSQAATKPRTARKTCRKS